MLCSVGIFTFLGGGGCMVFLQRENKPEEESLRNLNNINKSDVKILSIGIGLGSRTLYLI